MGRFTASDDPRIDPMVATHMKKIVAAIRANMDPDAIILRGSFGRGEGSVVIDDGQLKFLSDYEINVATYSPFHRAFFSKLSDILTAELGVETSLSWIRPDYFYKQRVGPFVIGPAQITITLYETRYGSRVLYGHDLVTGGPEINAHQISNYSGIQLMLNRMVESLHYLPTSNNNTDSELLSLFWVNKLVLACIEALLLVWDQYHFSYEERGERFTNLAKSKLDFMGDQKKILMEFAKRAIEFKLRPRRSLYLEQIQEAWLEVIPVCDLVFRHLVFQEWGLLFNNYIEFPEKYLFHSADNPNLQSYAHIINSKLLDLYKYARKDIWPLGLSQPHPVNRVIYSIVPLMFIGWPSPDEFLFPLLREVRSNLVKIIHLEMPSSNSRDEWSNLNKKMFWAWKNFCY